MSKEKMPVASGKMGEKARWVLYASNVLPPKEQCSAVFCLPFTESNRLAVMRHPIRGLGLIGGRIDPGESIEQTRDRELDEESGIDAKDAQVLGHLEITADEPVVYEGSDLTYPFPVSYQIYYHSRIDGEIRGPSSPDSLEVVILGRDGVSSNLRPPDSNVAELAFEISLRNQP
jgi:8-oxo-dGTP pyrophosphatase MutT (NUDIX family)